MGQNNYPPSSEMDIRDLQQRVKELEAAVQTRVALNTITGGTLMVQDAAGNTYLKIGRVSPDLPDGSPQYGVEIYRQGGDEDVAGLAFALKNFSGNIPAQSQILNMYDGTGQQVFGDDAVSAWGLAFPYMPLPLVPSDPSLWPSTTSSTMSDLWIGFPPIQNPKISVWGYMNAPFGTNASLQMISGSTVLGAPFTVTGQGVPNWFIFGPQEFPQLVGAQFANATDLRLQGCRTAGTGTVQVAVTACFGQQS